MLKRGFDIAASAIALVVFSPLILILVLLVRSRLGSPVFFRQKRPGLGAESFEVIKFRTMTDEIGIDGLPLPDADRLPPFGRWLRSTSLDELPELWNVLRGEMSLVGPRPLHIYYLPRYSPSQARRHEVRPGLTGWAQVNGRNAISWDEKFSLDVWYVDNRTFLLDLKIILITVAKIVRRDGISGEGEATMSEFMGAAPEGGARGVGVGTPSETR
jgi:lipopolysaccharide/colanic/teichoic acid biosynthesis glycosyltransferase